MPGSFALALFAIERCLRYAYHQAVRMYSIFHKILSELSFGMFISYSGLNVTCLKSFVEAHEKVLLAFTYFCNPYLLFDYGYSTFKNDPYFLDFVKKYRYLSIVWDSVEKQYKKDNIVDSIIDFIMHIITSPPWGFMSAIIALIVQDYLLYYGEWSNQIANIYDLAKGDIKTFINKVNETFDKAEPKPLDFLLPYIRVWKINPLMPFQYVDFLAHLHLNYAYKYILQNITEPKITTDFITKLQARLLFDGKVIRQERLKQDMSALFIIPKSEYEQYNPNIITVDIMGLKASWFKAPPLPFKVYVKDTETWINIPEEPWVKTEDLGEGWVRYWVEDMKGLENPDFDYDDIIIDMRFENDKLHVVILDGEHGFTNQLWYGENFIFEVKPKSDPTITKEYEAILDANTGEIIEVLYRAY